MNLKLTALCVVSFMAGHFLYRAWTYAKNRWKVPTFSGWEQLFKDNSKL